MSSEVKVGAFALGGAVALAGIISFMGALSFGPSGYELQIDYPQVNGLMPGHVVRYAGVQVGTVKRLNVAPDRVQVIAEINEEIQIPKGAVFTISSDGILGEKYVSVLPPAQLGAGYISKNSRVQGQTGGTMEDFFNNSGDLMKRLENIAIAFENIFGDKEVQQSMRDGFRNLRDISNNMNTFTKVMADVAVANQQDIVLMIRQMQELSQRMNNTARHVESIMANIDNNGATGRNVANMAQHLADTSARVENIVKVLEQVAQDPVTSNALKETLVNVKETSARANKILGTVTEAKLTADVAGSVEGGNWRSNLGVTFAPTKDSSLYVGGYDIGEANKLDLIATKDLGDAAVSLGAMQGEFGVGLSYKPMPSLRLYSQYYDFEANKLRLGGEIELTKGLSLYGETMDVKGNSSDTYVGLKGKF